jgi:hypothetical protein
MHLGRLLTTFGSNFADDGKGSAADSRVPNSGSQSTTVPSNVSSASSSTNPVWSINPKEWEEEAVEDPERSTSRQPTWYGSNMTYSGFPFSIITRLTDEHSSMIAMGLIVSTGMGTNRIKCDGGYSSPGSHISVVFTPVHSSCGPTKRLVLNPA